MYRSLLLLRHIRPTYTIILIANFNNCITTPGNLTGTVQCSWFLSCETKCEEENGGCVSEKDDCEFGWPLIVVLVVNSFYLTTDTLGINININVRVSEVNKS